MNFPRFLHPFSSKPDSDLAVEQLEPRVLFSAAPVDAAIPAQAEPEEAPTHEAPVAPSTAASSPTASPSVAEATPPVDLPTDVPQAQGSSDISAEQKVVLVDVDGSSGKMSQQAAKEASPVPSDPGMLLLLPTDTTSVEVDGNGNLVIEDVLGGDTDDKLFIGLVDGRLEVRDSRNTVGTSIADALEVGNRGRGVSIALGSFTGDIIVRTLGGGRTRLPSATLTVWPEE